jgi:hypothetical protein
MRSEASVNTLFNYRPFFPAVDDYLHQAADSANWPSGIKYDPGRTGKYFASLGVHEHWNNPVDKQYSKNLGSGNGIELVKIIGSARSTTAINNINVASGFGVYPNPATTNSAITYQLKSNTNVSVYLISMDGEIVLNVRQAQLSEGTYTDNINVQNLKTGTYICVLKTSDDIKTAKLEVR